MALFTNPANATDMRPTKDSTDAYREDYANNGAPAGQSDFGGDPGAADRYVDRYRRMAQARGAAPIQLDQTQANESRGMQMGALGLLRAQAEGTAPSGAELAYDQNNDAISAAGRAATGAKTAGGALAAQRSAGLAAGQTMAANNAHVADARLAELSRGAGQYATGTGQVQHQDIGAATANAKLQAQQNALDQQRRQHYEQAAWNTRNAQLQGHVINHQQIQQSLVNGANAANAEKAQGYAMGKDFVTGTLGLGMSMFSDERAKRAIVPMGSLAGLVRKGR